MGSTSTNRSESLLGSASRLALTTICPASQWLEQAEEPESWKKGGTRGTELHLFLETGRLDQVQPEYHEDCNRIPISQTAGVNAKEGCREIKFRYDLEKGKAEILWAKGHRDYGQPAPHLLSGTADVVHPGFKTWEVADYKTGKKAPKAAGNYQLLFLGLCTQLTLSPYARWGVLTIQHIQKTQIKTDSVLVDGWDLQKFRDELHDAYRKAKRWREAFDEGKTFVKKGDHCWLCLARTAGCPAWSNR